MGALIFTPAQLAFIEAQRVARLATADAQAQPHAMPVCYAHMDGAFYIALDAKPKRVQPSQLRRVRNILANPQAALLIDRYSEDWGELAYLLIRGPAALLPPDSAEHGQAVALLRRRYPQYQAMPIEEQPAIVLRGAALVAWGALG